MENINDKDENKLLDQAVEGIREDMAARDLGAIIWDNATAGFHYLPDVVTGRKDDKDIVVRVTGLYRYDGNLYMIAEGVKDADISNFYDKGVDVAPTVVTLTQNKAEELFGDPVAKEGFISDATLEEWLVIADDYFEALNEA